MEEEKLAWPMEVGGRGRILRLVQVKMGDDRERRPFPVGEREEKKGARGAVQTHRIPIGELKLFTGVELIAMRFRFKRTEFRLGN